MSYAIDRDGDGALYATGDFHQLLDGLMSASSEWLVVLDSAGAVRALGSNQFYNSREKMELRSVASALAATEGGEFVLVRAVRGVDGWKVEERTVRNVQRSP